MPGCKDVLPFAGESACQLMSTLYDLEALLYTQGVSPVTSCPHCMILGLLYIQGGGYLTCGNCAGNGSVPVSVAQTTARNGGEETCPFCSGTGKVMCTACLVSSAQTDRQTCIQTHKPSPCYVAICALTAVPFLCQLFAVWTVCSASK